MKPKVYQVTIPVTLYVTAPKELSDATKDEHAKGAVIVHAKRCVAGFLEDREEGAFQQFLPSAEWEVMVRSVEKASHIKRFLP
jgi:PII-like signaling protein